MALDLRRVLRELAAAAATIPGVTTYAYVPDSITAPAFYTGEVVGRYDQTFGGLAAVTVTCRLLVSLGVDGSGQAELLDLMGTGPGSVKAALEAARGGPGEYALNGAADDLHVPGVQGHRLYTFGPETYVGADWAVEVIGGGDG
ncbi:hypothetical protein OOK41_01320 [Micromonospora sp. NBC_01655]|uniref:hypothetical protein n=1 Tax=Micromonospora sp. NBC_01655 TaxID=2975983 RepID=UPI002259F5BE|nr:hypothetical protein [Micromonospora sp. NBC_01655]MCX4468964.1 hypothetical protein [Micromonospora sp. NBC_01655]